MSGYIHGFRSRDVHHLYDKDKIEFEKIEDETLAEFIKRNKVDYVHLTYIWTSTNTAIEKFDSGEDSFYFMGSLNQFDAEYSYTGKVNDKLLSWAEDYESTADQYVDDAQLWKLDNGMIVMFSRHEEYDMQGGNSDSSTDDIDADLLAEHTLFDDMIEIDGKLYW